MPTALNRPIGPSPVTRAVSRGQTASRLVEVLASSGALLWTDLMAGFFYAFDVLMYAFDVLMMPGLAHANGLAALDAMQQINAAIDHNPLFGAGFFGAAIVTLAAVVTGIVRRDSLAGAGGLII